MLDAALAAWSVPIRLDDPDLQENERDAMMPSSDFVVSEFDAEEFIYSLPYRESVVLLLRSFRKPISEVKKIARILKVHPSRIYDSIKRLEKRANERL